VTAPPEDPPRDVQAITGQNPLTGATVGNLNPAFADELGVDGAERGVVVSEVKQGSIAQRLGVAKRDLVVSLNGRSIANVAALRQALAVASQGWTLTVRRGEKLLSVTVRG